MYYRCIIFPGLLIAKLHEYGVSVHACKLIASYFTDRKQRVKIGENRSDWIDINIGAPQGSLIGPFSYNIFTNDLLLKMETICEIYNYADDNSVCCYDSDINCVKTSLEHICNFMILWFEQNYLKANPDKFQAIVFGNHSDLHDVTINIGQTYVNTCDMVKLLGVYIDKDLDFTHHISEMCKKVSRKVNALSRLTPTLNMQSKLTLYNCFILSQFGYCSIIWHFCKLADVKKMEKLQYRALKIVSQNFNATYKELLDIYEMPLLYVRRIRSILIETYRILNKIGPKYLHNLLSLKDSVYNLRTYKPVQLKPCKSNKYGLKSFSYEAGNLWNFLPTDIKCANDLKRFKDLLCQWKPDCTCNVCTICSLYINV